MSNGTRLGRKQKVAKRWEWWKTWCDCISDSRRARYILPARGGSDSERTQWLTWCREDPCSRFLLAVTNPYDVCLILMACNGYSRAHLSIWPACDRKHSPMSSWLHRRALCCHCYYSCSENYILLLYFPPNMEDSCLGDPCVDGYSSEIGSWT